MKVKFSTLMLGIATILASCSQSDDLLQSEQTNTSDGLKAVTITATLPEDGMITRSVTANEDDEVGRCLLQILVQGEDGSYSPATGDLSGVKMMEPNGTNSYKVSGIYLNKNDDYKFLFWADGGSGYNTATDLRNVTLTDNNANPGIAWQSSVTWSDQSKSAAISANLTHAVAKVTLKTTSNLDASTPVSITIGTAYTAFNVEKGVVVSTATVSNKLYDYTVASSITATPQAPEEVFSFYALVSDATQEVVLANGNNTDTNKTMSSVPLGPNKHTTLQGDVRNLGLTGVEFTATIVTGWDKPGTDPTPF